MVPYTLENVSHHMSFLEMLDVLNEDLIKKGARAGAPDMKYETCVARGFSPCLTADPKGQCRCLTRQIQPTRFSCAISNFGRCETLMIITATIFISITNPSNELKNILIIYVISIMTLCYFFAVYKKD